MLAYDDFAGYFGTSLFNKKFQEFLLRTFIDLTEYNILEGDYISSKIEGIDLGFTNNEAVYDDDSNVLFEPGNPLFSHFIVYPIPGSMIVHLPFGVGWGDKRDVVIQKAGQPLQTKQGYANFLRKFFLVDNYKVGDIVVSFDYAPDSKTINHIQVRDNNLVVHLKL